MPFCSECGKEIKDEREVCVECVLKNAGGHSDGNSIAHSNSNNYKSDALAPSASSSSQKYVYKTSSLNHFLHVQAKNKSGMKLGAMSSMLNAEGDTAPKVAAMIEYMLNYYAKGGWEFFRVEEFDPTTFMSIGGMVASGIFGGIASDQRSKTEKKIPVVIFRKLYDINENVSSLESYQNQEASVNAEPNHGGAPSTKSDSTCPDCASPLHHADLTCWKCKADFSNPQGWKPIPIY